MSPSRCGLFLVVQAKIEAHLHTYFLSFFSLYYVSPLTYSYFAYVFIVCLSTRMEALPVQGSFFCYCCVFSTQNRACPYSRCSINIYWINDWNKYQFPVVREGCYDMPCESVHFSVIDIQWMFNQQAEGKKNPWIAEANFSLERRQVVVACMAPNFFTCEEKMFQSDFVHSLLSLSLVPLQEGGHQALSALLGS